VRARLTCWSSLVIAKRTFGELRDCGGNGLAFVVAIPSEAQGYRRDLFSLRCS
jgi:hypothetical protein